jgi:hypothetical protein
VISNQLEPFLRGRRLKEKLGRSLGTRFFVRFHASLIMLGTIAAGWLADWAMLKHGLENMLLRYPAAVFVAYLAFLIGARIWIEYSGIREYMNARGAQELLDLPEGGARAPVAGRVGQNRDLGGWDIRDIGGWDIYSLGLFSEIFFGVLLAAAVVSLVALLVYGTGVYIIVEAEGFFAEIVFELLLAAGLVRGMRKIDSPGWVGGFVSVTWPALFIVMTLSLGIGALAEYRYPGAKTMAELIAKIRTEAGKPGGR